MAGLRVIFMGSPDFAVPTLTAILDAGHDVPAVYAQPPRPAGRGQKERPCPVHAFAAEQGLEVRTPVSLKDADAQANFADLDADIAVVVAYGLILPKVVLDAPGLGCINGHASLLPRWRGAAPIQRAIMAGDKESGVSIMQMDEGLDTGGVLLREAVPITLTTTATELHDTLCLLSARLTVEALENLPGGGLVAVPQPEEGVTYAAKLSREEGRLDWARPAEELERSVRALNPWPGVWFEHQGERIKVLAAEVAPGSGAPGTVLDGFNVACGTDALNVTKAQRPGKGPLDAEAFLRGYDLDPGIVLA
ncbi:MAG: methionyl-tRNA formyltransferase [Rhodospirillales bacterium]|jgi:methionyl-tRNA formyltransferase|nr:methionyl-tRNA formyltransferase [Rhodospirillaceae bacterium]MBT7486122.1 methionyl-tRNA formyltransferase [Rhodospirillales bacterium]MBT5034658.1 methionyl-tRNA formyltransferase [Rhodospirillaceae bacterium]MBT6220502.1 methionyl-tRNA formyltransferase [Rhodospirillaceae bacterium]MBT6362673.1 methionyl-tRNA formyltransferase [Rhodospirillaceae bacterium]